MTVLSSSLDSTELLKTLWKEVSEKLIHELGETIFKSWLQPLSIEKLEDGYLHLTVPTRFVKDWVLANYGEKLLHHWKTALPEVKKLVIEVQSVSSEGLKISPQDRFSSPEETLDEQREDLGAALDNRFTFENFVVGKPNEFAYAAALRVAESDAPLFNPLFLYGGVGLGKTHLMHAIAWHIKKTHPQRKVIYLSAEKFMYQFIRAPEIKAGLGIGCRYPPHHVRTSPGCSAGKGREHEGRRA